ncbi:hypothetical protein AVEN_178434-1 [Araneus ventricosus]|uniref:Uncharacterized protein n=1 Tax=Araneus ventricosus TaxID=182803 RepID=A0A4Y2WBC8_ARAVE|nr:hypothetical protein AVEN_178434-1 [Araneus ventricosus]
MPPVLEGCLLISAPPESYLYSQPALPRDQCTPCAITIPLVVVLSAVEASSGSFPRFLGIHLDACREEFSPTEKRRILRQISVSAKDPRISAHAQYRRKVSDRRLRMVAR